jgi:hypothetical protein
LIYYLLINLNKKKNDINKQNKKEKKKEKEKREIEY